MATNMVGNTATILRHHSPEPVQSPIAPNTLVATNAPSAMKRPWPKFSTSMRPNTSVNPEAMMKMIMPMAKPATVSVSQVELEPTKGHASKANTGTSSSGRVSMFSSHFIMPTPTTIVVMLCLLPVPSCCRHAPHGRRLSLPLCRLVVAQSECFVPPTKWSHHWP